MASIKENFKAWSNYDWPEEGDEWSKPWATSNNMWHGTIFPRIKAYIPADHILEIAPGFGRCTKYLAPMCKKLTLVDIARRCIEVCKQKFAGSSHIRYYVNDGKSLDFLENDSVDFVFSWDSLVHANGEVFSSYLKDLSKKMKIGGFGFIHHSNMGEYYDISTGRMTIESKHWRDTSMSAKLFRDNCANIGLRCVSQEIIEWEPGILSDAFSLFTRELDSRFEQTRLIENREFIQEVANLKRIHELYNRDR